MFLIGKDASPNEWCIRSTSRSLPTPTTSESYSSKKFRPMESPEPGTLNIFSMASLDNGNGPNTRRTIGAIILACPCIIATFPKQFHGEYLALWQSSAAADHCNLGCLGYTQLHERLSAALASGELGEHWRMVERLSFSDAIQTLMTPPRTSSENDNWGLVASRLKRLTPPHVP